MSELNTEKERLVGLSREKAHADKLKSRVSDHKSTIAAKEVEYEQAKNQHDSLAEANRKFYDYSNKFREIYVKVESLEDKEERLRSDRDDAMLSLQKIEGLSLCVVHLLATNFFSGTDEELEARLRHFDDHINSQKQKIRLEDTRKQDVEDELSNARDRHKELLARQGALTAEAEVKEDVPTLSSRA
jgi:DNA repair protein RAD50